LPGRTSSTIVSAPRLRDALPERSSSQLRFVLKTGGDF
jgi:hypothetical protein